MTIYLVYTHVQQIHWQYKSTWTAQIPPRP